jgi:hypothetical protein
VGIEIKGDENNINCTLAQYFAAALLAPLKETVREEHLELAMLFSICGDDPVHQSIIIEQVENGRIPSAVVEDIFSNLVEMDSENKKRRVS